MRNKTALITGITGQDGSYLAEYLLSKHYTVWGLLRRTSSFKSLWRLQDMKESLLFVDGDVTDLPSLIKAVRHVQPDEIYNLAAQSHVGLSFEMPVHTSEVTGLGAMNVFEAALHCERKVRVYQASSSEMYGSTVNLKTGKLDESSPFRPISPYAIAKLYAHRMAEMYRNTKKLFVSCGILFNHESPRRGEDFVTSKIVRGAVRIKYGEDKSPIELGNLHAVRDWGYAKDYVEAMHAMLQLDKPEDFVICSGEHHSVEHFAKCVFEYLGIENWHDYINENPVLFRPCEVHMLCGNSSKAQYAFNWKPRASFDELVMLMVEAEKMHT